MPSHGQSASRISTLGVDVCMCPFGQSTQYTVAFSATYRHAVRFFCAGYGVFGGIVKTVILIVKSFSLMVE
jgi:hypothetical protein